MKILLVIPHPNARYGLISKLNYPSLALKQIAALTPWEHEVEIVDERYERINFNKDYDVVGISCLTYNSIRGYEVAREFKKRGATIVFGGYHATLMPGEVKHHADCVVIGEAELTWVKVLEDIEKGQLKSFYKADRLTEAEEIPPARHDIGSCYPFIETVQASRGCPIGCEFCAMQKVEGSRFRGRPVEHMIEEIKSIKTKNIFFADASLTINPSYSKSLFKGLKELNKYFECFANINVLANDDEFLKLASEAGFLTWYVGIESISQENIDAVGKSTNKVENYGKAIQKIKDYGMRVACYMMVGFDNDTLETFDKTLQAVYNWGVDEVAFSIVIPFPGTRLYERYEKEGKIICKDWSKYLFENVVFKPKNMTPDELLQGASKMYSEFYSIPNTIIRVAKNIPWHIRLGMFPFFLLIARNVSYTMKCRRLFTS